ncbi:E3 ubiquitin-protein ligase RNF213, partial [Mesitornis unicolor]
GVTVYFHAILSKDFKLNPETHKVFIRAGNISHYESWKDNICELSCTKHLEEHGYLIEGTVTLAKDNMNKYIPYKYWVVCEQGKYEFIYRQPVTSSYVNRCLLIKSDLLSNGEWHQYDDVVCAEPSVVKHLWQWLSRTQNKQVVEGKTIAASIMLENIFSILGTWSPDNLRNFLCQLHQFYVVTVNPCIHDGKETPWTELNFGTEQVNDLLLKYMGKIAHPFLAPEGAKASQKDAVIKSKLALGLVILSVVVKLELPASESNLADLCSLLCLEEVSQQAVLDEIHQIKKAFTAVASLRVYLTDLCQRCIAARVNRWVWILPLLHFFAPPLQHDHLPMEEDTWAGLEGLPYAETRQQQDGGTLLQVMKEKKYLMELDKTLVKSWICVLPLQSLPEFIKDFSGDLLAALQGVCYRLEPTDLSWQLCPAGSVAEHEELNIYLHAKPVALKALEARSWQSCLSCCLKLHKKACKYVKHFMIPATSAMMISQVAKLQPAAVPRDAVKEVPVVEVFNEALRDTRTWFRNALNEKLLKEYLEHVTFSFHWELLAWNVFVTMSFPNEQFTERWKKTLLADLERRIREEPPFNQILVYCCQHYQFSQLDSSIEWCFSNCAIEAVAVACQTQSNLLEKLSSCNLGRFSQLVSAIIVKSWPIKSGQSENFDEILHHVLTWPDIQRIFSFNGTNAKLLEELTDEAKNIMATADSVFTSVTHDIQKGSIRVKHLEAIFQHEKQFLCIWEINEFSFRAPADVIQLEELLQRRQEEVALLREEKKAIGTFLNMCRKVQAAVKVNVGAVESQHLEDLSSKRLNTVVNMTKRPTETYYSLSPELKESAQKMHSFKDSLIFQQFWEEAAQKAGEEYENSEEEYEFSGEEVGSSEEEDNFVPALELDEVFSSIISPCFKRYERLYGDLRSGSLTLSTVDKIFQQFRNQPEDIKTELDTICQLRPGEDRGWVDQRFRQIQQYHEMHLSFDAAKIIANVKESLNLSGDFSILENLLDITEKLESYKTQKLDSISPELMHAKKLLQGITVNRRECLRELAQQKEFVCWVREALKDINELKVFVDLASISAGENDMDVDRVACFHDTVHGYSSLLYELRQESGFEDFMNCLKKLWRALDSDENLPKKLVS